MKVRCKPELKHTIVASYLAPQNYNRYGPILTYTFERFFEFLEPTTPNGIRFQTINVSYQKIAAARMPGDKAAKTMGDNTSTNNKRKSTIIADVEIE